MNKTVRIPADDCKKYTFQDYNNIYYRETDEETENFVLLSDTVRKKHYKDIFYSHKLTLYESNQISSLKECVIRPFVCT